MSLKNASELLTPAQIVTTRSAPVPQVGTTLQIDFDLTDFGSENRTGTDGSVANGGTVLTSAAGGIPTDSTYVGGKLRIVESGHATAGEYTILSTTATTVTITGGTFPAVGTNLDFKISKNPGYMKPFARRVWVGTGGNIALKQLDDTGAASWRVYKNVANGTPLDGAFIAIGSTANGTTAYDLVVEQ